MMARYCGAQQDINSCSGKPEFYFHASFEYAYVQCICRMCFVCIDVSFLKYIAVSHFQFDATHLRIHCIQSRFQLFSASAHKRIAAAGRCFAVFCLKLVIINKSVLRWPRPGKAHVLLTISFSRRSSSSWLSSSAVGVLLLFLRGSFALVSTGTSDFLDFALVVDAVSDG